MAKVSIYVSDELRSRMLSVGDDLNWSEVARTAFEQAIANHTHKRMQSMDSAIERLRVSKEKHLLSLQDNGYQDGQAWARDHAEYADLLALDDLDGHLDDMGGNAKGEVLDMIKSTIDGDNNMTMDEFREVMFGESTFPDNNAYAIKFAQGAVEFFQRIRSKI